MRLLIDVGNTATKFAYFEGEFHYVGRLYNKDINEDSVLALLKSLSNIDSIYISSVAPKIRTNLVVLLENRYGVKPVIVSNKIESNIKIEIDNREELGVDLLCDLEAAYKEYGPKTAVIDFGTATKILFINDKGVFNSCAIFLGYMKSKRILADSTELLPEVENKDIKPISRCHNTVDVIDSSAYYSQLFSVKGIIEEYEKEVGYTLRKVFTGGNAKDFINHFKEDNYDEYLVLKGLLILSNRKELHHEENTIR